MEKELEKKLRKIAVVGPESTGKSTMTLWLARALNTYWVPEYSRYYCEELDRDYTLQDELNMFFGQIALEDSIVVLADQSEFILCDTTFMTIKIWSDYLFGSTPEVVVRELHKRKYDFYLLMDIDMPWEDDPLRDFPDLRDHFLGVWKKELKDLNAEYKVISGLGEERHNAALSAVREFLENPGI